MEFATALVMIYLSCAGGIVWAIYNWLQVKNVHVGEYEEGLEEGLQREDKKLDVLVEIGQKISDGA